MNNVRPSGATPSNAEKMSALGLGSGAAFGLFLALNIAGLAWVAMLVIGAIWHVFDVGSPIGFWASVPVGFGLLLVAFVVSRQRMR
ncbi:MAG: hypothetical protein EX269_06225 [Acidimicrobiales bacterium]|nr:MAG: hypothetical protein EX269_06225 [Acidimicrobiales bacterium]